MILDYRTVLLLCTFIGAFLFLEDIDRSAEWQTSLELMHAQQEEQLFDLMLALETAETE